MVVDIKQFFLPLKKKKRKKEEGKWEAKSLLGIDLQ